MKLRFHTYSGMQVPITVGDMDDVREAAADYLYKRWKSGDYTISILNRGIEWELITQENEKGYAVTDEDGILKVHP